MKIQTTLLLAVCCLLAACGRPERYVEIASSLPNVEVYFNGKKMGKAPVQLSESKLKECGLSYPYSIKEGNTLWEAWDIDQKTSGAITVQNEPNSNITGRFQFKTTPNEQSYQTVSEEGSSWLIFQLRFEPIGSMPDHELGRRMTIMPVKAEPIPH